MDRFALFNELTELYWGKKTPGPSAFLTAIWEEGSIDEIKRWISRLKQEKILAEWPDPNYMRNDMGTTCVTDPIVNSILKKIVDRHKVGMVKYGVTLAANPLPTLAWITHAQEEAIDFIHYLERLKQDLVKNEPPL